MPNRLTTAALLLTLAGSTQAPAKNSFPAVFDLASLDGTNGFTVLGPSFSVSAAGDFNGDGVNDILMGGLDGGTFRGRTFVVYGGSGVGDTGIFDTASITGTTGIHLFGIDAFDYSGTDVSCAGDVNGDGIDDIIIGARYADPNGANLAGESYVVFGSEDIGTSESSRGSPPWVVPLASLDGTNGFVLNGVSEFDLSGFSVSSDGDMNGDGLDDVLIGARSASGAGSSGPGQGYVVFGSANVGASGVIELADLDGTDGFVLNGTESSVGTGASVSPAGDVNADGFDDIIIGAPFTNLPGADAAGESYVVFGGKNVGAGGALDLSTLDGTNGFALSGIDFDDLSSFSVACAGDVNGDGISDLLIGAYRAKSTSKSAQERGAHDDTGEAYVVFGAAGIGASGSIELSLLNGTTGFVILAVDLSDGCGYAVSSAGDMNDDGIDDVMVSSPFADNGDPEESNAGETYVIYGSHDLGAAGSFALSSLNGENGFVLRGLEGGDLSGWSISAAGDVNNDGINDLLIGARNASESYIVFGVAPPPPDAADFNADCSTDSTDLAILLAAWNTPRADLSGDGTTDRVDLAILLAEWTR